MIKEVLTISEPSVLTPTDAQIKYILFRREAISKILLAISEEPCYLSELVGRLCISKPTVMGAIHYLDNCNLITRVSDNHYDERVKTLLKIKKARLLRKLHPELANNVLKRMDFFFVTQKAVPFLNHARKCLFGVKE